MKLSMLRPLFTRFTVSIAFIAMSGVAQANEPVMVGRARAHGGIDTTMEALEKSPTSVTYTQKEMSLRISTDLNHVHTGPLRLDYGADANFQVQVTALSDREVRITERYLTNGVVLEYHGTIEAGSWGRFQAGETIEVRFDQQSVGRIWESWTQRLLPLLAPLFQQSLRSRGFPGNPIVELSVWAWNPDVLRATIEDGRDSSIRMNWNSLTRRDNPFGIYRLTATAK